MSHRIHADQIVADGPERIMSGPTYKATAQRVRYRMNRRCWRILADASFIGKLFIRFRIRRFVWRRLERLAPPGALYVSEALCPITPTSSKTMPPTAGRRESAARFCERVLDVDGLSSGDNPEVHSWPSDSTLGKKRWQTLILR